MIHEIEGVLIVTKCVHCIFANSLDEAHEWMSDIPRLY